MSKTYFISGHLDLSATEFEQHYRLLIDNALENKSSFVVGDAKGTDQMAQKYLHQRTNKVIVYHMFDKPRNNLGFPTKGGFRNDNERDSAMTSASDIDIAWARSEEEQRKKYGKKYRKRKSGTQKNIERRFKTTAIHSNGT